jgi:hypothetical protein
MNSYFNKSFVDKLKDPKYLATYAQLNNTLDVDICSLPRGMKSFSLRLYHILSREWQGHSKYVVFLGRSVGLPGFDALLEEMLLCK